MAAAQSTVHWRRRAGNSPLRPIFGAGTKADIDTPQGEQVKVDQSFGDILGDLKFAFMGAFEAATAVSSSVHDIMYLSLGIFGGRQIGPIPLEADVDLKLLTTTHLVGYRVID